MSKINKDVRKRLILRFQEPSDLSMKPVTASGPTLHKTSRDTRNPFSWFLLKGEKEYAHSGIR
jgi:hypothetical protein